MDLTISFPKLLLLLFILQQLIAYGLPGWLIGKESVCNTGDLGLIPKSRRAPGEGNGNPLQYSFLGNHTDRDA